MHVPRTLVAALVVATLASLVVTSPAAADSDLNGDGRDDLVVGVPDEAIAQVNEAGVVNVIRGGANGLAPARDRLWDQADLSGTVEASDRFGSAIAYGDFDGDGLDDVAIGAPTESWNGQQFAGVVHVVYGSPGLGRSRRQVLSQVRPVAGKNESGDFFGAVLVSGDFDGDGRDDLAIGAPGEDVAGRVASGGVGVVFGSASGLDPSDSVYLTQRGRVPGKARPRDGFGAALAAGDFDGDGDDDLAIGVPGKSTPTAESGAVVILDGRRSGIDKAGSIIFQHTAGFDTVGTGDWFGFALAAGDFDNDGHDDLAVGIRFDDDGATNAGSIGILPGSPTGITTTGAYRILRSGGAVGTAAEGDQFGYSLAAGDLVGGPADDLVVGMPFDDIDGVADTGSVLVIPGSNSGQLDTGATTTISQGPLATAADEPGDRLGETLRIGDFNGDGNDDLAIGSPFQDVNGRADNGVIYVVYSDGTALDVTGNQRFHQGTPGIKGTAEADDRFGSGL